MADVCITLEKRGIPDTARCVDIRCIGKEVFPMPPLSTRILASGEAFPTPYQHGVGKASPVAFLPTYFSFSPTFFGVGSTPVSCSEKCSVNYAVNNVRVIYLRLFRFSYCLIHDRLDMTIIYFSFISFNFVTRSFNLVTRSFRFRFGFCLVHDCLNMATIYFSNSISLILLHGSLICLRLNLVTQSFIFDCLDLGTQI